MMIFTQLSKLYSPFFFRFLSSFTIKALDCLSLSCKNSLIASNVIFNRFCDLVKRVSISCAGKALLNSDFLQLVVGSSTEDFDQQLEQCLNLNFQAEKLKVKVSKL